ncbi:hypothetical protein KFK09_009274 [Dendrobium nobile]|uniref:Uncharacterized protein n=1 Tax=Dendrobium nobile TaxID=94219 RepID=A0A8T3BNC6_DENNO|nr:hypothetical protein KFK09_009274 [Dendrobium nobile]
MDDDEAAFSFDGFSEEAKQEIGCWEPMAPILASRENFRSWEMVSNSYHDCSIFPPNLHEGLHVRSNPDQILAPSFPSPLQQIKGAAIEQCLPERRKEEKESCPASNWISISAHRSIVSWFEVIRSKVSGGGGSAEAFGVGICSCAALASLAGIFMYLRHRHRREKEFLLFLIQEKNQKIGLLLHQIAELNAVLAAHRKVPVLKRT